MSQCLACLLAKLLNLFKLQVTQEEVLSKELDMLVSSSDGRLGLEIALA